MKFFLIDYTELCYRDEIGGETPDEVSGKFVQIRDSGAEYLVFSPKECAYYHANIVERFFLSRGITGSYNSKGDFYSIDHPDWTVVGGGQWIINRNERELRLLGESQAYGKFDHEGLKERILLLDEMSGYRVRISSQP